MAICESFPCKIWRCDTLWRGKSKQSAKVFSLNSLLLYTLMHKSVLLQCGTHYWLVPLTSYSLQWMRLAFFNFSSALTFPTLSLHLSGTMVSARWHSQYTVSEGGREGGGREGEEGREEGRMLHVHHFILALRDKVICIMQ